MLASARIVPPCIKTGEIEMGLDIDQKRSARRKKSALVTSITRIITKKKKIKNLAHEIEKILNLTG